MGTDSSGVLKSLNLQWVISVGEEDTHGTVLITAQARPSPHICPNLTAATKLFTKGWITRGLSTTTCLQLQVGISIPVPSQCRWKGMLLRFVLGWWPLAQKSWDSSESQRKECWVANGTRSQRLGRKTLTGRNRLWWEKESGSFSEAHSYPSSSKESWKHRKQTLAPTAL